ncbi:hypothetical protein LU293_05795 [Moraxella nasovis]|uniref:hypothetical protein n=1 Tax=Moraxella nasovis TaxID=2904121 RepID=UPI001F61C64C|nr:hypothetical protein [Moraxella nasovis]UNU72630.1 hypothetical protein LU293_05795 [Moraxella nasovis]
MGAKESFVSMNALKSTKKTLIFLVDFATMASHFSHLRWLMDKNVVRRAKWLVMAWPV